MKTNSENQKSGLKNRSEQLSKAQTRSDSSSAPSVREDHRLPIDVDRRKANRELPTPKILNLLLTRLPDAFGVAEVVGKWIWVQFEDVPAAEIRKQLSELGFHWNNGRRAWQHPCGLYRNEVSSVDPRNKKSNSGCFVALSGVNVPHSIRVLFEKRLARNNPLTDPVFSP